MSTWHGVMADGEEFMRRKISLRSRRIKERGWGRRKIGKKRWSGGGGGGGKRTPAIKAPIGSFLRSLAAAKFLLVIRTIGRVCEVLQYCENNQNGKSFG